MQKKLDIRRQRRTLLEEGKELEVRGRADSKTDEKPALGTQAASKEGASASTSSPAHKVSRTTKSAPSKNSRPGHTDVQVSIYMVKLLQTK